MEKIATNINSQEQVQPSQIIGEGQGRGGYDIFQVHFKKSKQPNANGLYKVTCNYYQKKIRIQNWRWVRNVSTAFNYQASKSTMSEKITNANFRVHMFFFYFISII